MKKKNSDTRTLLGMTLSKKGWNNVVIYIVLILMFAFYFMGHRDDQSAESHLQPFADQVLVGLSDNERELIRVGNRWQLQRGELSQEEQAKWLSAWQNIELRVHEGLLQGQEYGIEIILLDVNEPVNVAVFFTADKTLVALPGYDHVFKVMNPEPDALRP
ncbi:hypothetical protein CWE09_08925 [Aliidiomarina minuta]|uniref:Uncharacterized protein n=1 Tax=Aliidiomarina minuta TaxID=880057 RepID=A0A432W9G7_9GAMM|nr:hypothetical protein [Aliidiomarina minuta]RUO26797.1 hypothetical protein CWE09_08925 [Aliidiomarina minuta]